VTIKGDIETMLVAYRDGKRDEAETVADILEWLTSGDVLRVVQGNADDLEFIAGVVAIRRDVL
jgi:hypothetical protein